jgi:hypothetical protein
VPRATRASITLLCGFGFRPTRSAPITNPASFHTLLGPIVGQAYITAGGYCNLLVQSAVAYVAVFDMSAQAPLQAAFITPGLPKFVTFNGAAVGSVTQIVAPGYRSPVLSAAGYASVQAGIRPAQWFDTEASTLGGNAYNIALLIGAMFAQADSFAEIIHGAIRLQSSTGSQIDLWVRDFFGGNFPRLQGETDASYVARVFEIFKPPTDDHPCHSRRRGGVLRGLSRDVGLASVKGKRSIWRAALTCRVALTYRARSLHKPAFRKFMCGICNRVPTSPTSGTSTPITTMPRSSFK